MTLDPVELDRHIAQLPPLVDDPAYLVFADWLQSHGHPWGELVVLHHRIAHAATPAERDELELAAQLLLDDHGPKIAGDVPLHDLELDWHLGFMRRARLALPADGTQVLAMTKAVLALPAARMLESLVLAPVPESFATTRDWRSSDGNIVDPWPDWDALGPLVRGRVPELGFGGWPARAAAAYVYMPSFDAISRWLRDLRRLELTGNWRESREVLDLPNLVELAVHFADAGTQALAALAASKLPQVERLTVGLGGASHCILDDVYAPDDYDDDDPDKERYPSSYSADDLENLEVHGVRLDLRAPALRELLDALPPKVTELSLASSVLGAEVLAAIASHPRVSQLRRLDLSACTITDRTAPVLIENAAVLARIAALDLSRNRVDKLRSRLAAALPNATLGGDSQGHPDFFMRYVATME